MQLKKADIILIIILVLVAAAFPFMLNYGGGEGARAVILVDGKEYASYRLDEDGEYTIDTAYGSNIILIEGGAARMTEADCPDGYCKKYAPISKNGESIICLPHRLVVEIEGGTESGVDAVAQ